MTRSLPPEWDDDRRPGGGNPQGNIAPTDWKVIIVAALCGAALGWFALSIYKINDVTVPILPWSLPVVILVAAIATWIIHWFFATLMRVPLPRGLLTAIL